MASSKLIHRLVKNEYRGEYKIYVVLLWFNTKNNHSSLFQGQGYIIPILYC